MLEGDAVGLSKSTNSQDCRVVNTTLDILDLRCKLTALFGPRIAVVERGAQHDGEQGQATYDIDDQLRLRRIFFARELCLVKSDGGAWQAERPG